MIRTCDSLIRSQVLYPTELRVRKARFKTTNVALLCQVYRTQTLLSLGFLQSQEDIVFIYHLSSITFRLFRNEKAITSEISDK